MAIVNLGVRFLVELAGVVAVAAWGLHASPDPIVGVLVGLAAAPALVVTWSLVVAPRATNRLRQPTRDLVGTVLLLVAAAALAGAGQPLVGVVLAAVVAVNQVLLVLLGTRARDALGPSRRASR